MMLSSLHNRCLTAPCKPEIRIVQAINSLQNLMQKEPLGANTEDAVENVFLLFSDLERINA